MLRVKQRSQNLQQSFHKMYFLISYVFFRRPNIKTFFGITKCFGSVKWLPAIQTAILSDGRVPDLIGFGRIAINFFVTYISHTAFFQAPSMRQYFDLCPGHYALQTNLLKAILNGRKGCFGCISFSPAFFFKR
jgi:hypothetical protein